MKGSYETLYYRKRLKEFYKTVILPNLFPKVVATTILTPCVCACL